MAVKLGSSVKVGLEVNGEEVLFTFRQPSNAELNRFLSGRFSMKGRQMSDRSVQARVEFFDLLVEKIENVEDEAGAAVGVEQKDKIPANWKNAAILQAFEDTEAQVKN